MVLFAYSHGFQRTDFWPSYFWRFLFQTETVRSKICINVQLHYCILLVHSKKFSDRALDRELPPTKLPLNYATMQCGNGWKGWKQSEGVEGCTCSHMIQLCNVSSDDKPSCWNYTPLTTCLPHHKIFALPYLELVFWIKSGETYYTFRH